MPRFDELSQAEQEERLERLARKALVAYRLEGAQIRRMRASRNAVYEVCDAPNGRYVLRISRPDCDGDNLTREMLWLSAIRRETSLSVPEPILGHTGELCQHVAMRGVPGFRWCTLYQWVDGEPHRGAWTEARLVLAGAFLAALHRHATSFRWPSEVGPRRLDATAVEAVVEAPILRRACTGEELAILRALGARVRRAMADAGERGDVSGVIHSELGRGHLLFDREKVGAVGFEDCRWGPFLYDLSGVWDELRGGDGAEELRCSLLHGYASVRPLPTDAERLLAVFSGFRALLSLARAAQQAELDLPSGRRLGMDSPVRTALTRVLQRAQPHGGGPVGATGVVG